MTNIKTNAIRIAELKYPLIKGNCPIIHRENLYGVSKRYKEYNGLMPIVFESNNTNYEIHLYSSCVQLNTNDIQIFDYNSEPEFIEAIQLAVIKYLELKNG